MGKATQKELQVVGGGFVYMAMYRRPMLCGLNKIWEEIVSLEGKGQTKRHRLGTEVMKELARFIGLLPLAFINLRAPFDQVVTVSDASTTGGGFCASRGLSPYGLAASGSVVRGELPDEEEITSLLSIGLFDGIAALRVALDCLGVVVSGHISVERSAEAQRVVESFFPDSILVDDIMKVDEEMVKSWSLRFSGVSLILIGAGPPCQGVSGLNWDRKGALRDARSALFQEVPRIKKLCCRFFPWAQIHSLCESVASMDYDDCMTMSQAFEVRPWFLDASGVSLCHRPRVYWPSWELVETEGSELVWGTDGRLPIVGEVVLSANVEEKHYLEAGWSRWKGRCLPTFTTSRPSPTPLRKPAGLKDCAPHELERWSADLRRFPPYQYMDINTVHSSTGEARPPSVLEREVILGFPAHYTKACFKKADQGSTAHQDARLTLLGNTWCVPVIAWLLSTLLVRLGFMGPISVQELVERIRPGGGQNLQSLLLRPPLGHSTLTHSLTPELTRKLCSLISLKGEDLLVQGLSETPVRFHRLRSSVPSRLWRWKTIAGWQWTGEAEHINVLELRAVMTSIKWRAEQQSQVNLRCVHLTDSLVVLHALTRGRSSSRKMRRTLMRLNSYLLLTELQPLWGYVNTHDNPADAPSRRGVKKKWLKRGIR